MSSMTIRDLTPVLVDKLTAAGVILVDLIELNSDSAHADNSWRLALDLIGEKINNLVLDYYHKYNDLISKSPIDLEFEDYGIADSAEYLIKALADLNDDMVNTYPLNLDDIIDLIQDGHNSVILTERANLVHDGTLRSPWDILQVSPVERYLPTERNRDTPPVA